MKQRRSTDETLGESGCKTLFYEDTISGAKCERPELNRALEHLRAGDTLVVWKLDRLGRSVKELVGELAARGVQG